MNTLNTEYKTAFANWRKAHSAMRKTNDKKTMAKYYDATRKLNAITGGE